MALRASLLGLTSRLTSSTLTRPFSSSVAAFAQRGPNPAVSEATTNNPTTPTSPLAADFTTLKELSTSLEPYAGRSIGNVNNPNVAYRKVNAICRWNNVQREIRANRYYEKPTVARRRKNIERNRKLFGAMVGKKVALIMQMKNR
ncbi:ribosomal protein S21 [Lichtheimia ornata]|uniref:Ribosomal protein S21 n=1 Tax=Lichtheimia ornata TaxID=688661 RepID=A0AAD7V8Q9_9FUNG|nr:ribosomal protein S21 [Lichtheimia ornata]KAJ8660496.1 ribosomal protein S21 [Lichtheimia ornata]